MHLMTALELKQPGMLFRGVILLAQGESGQKIVVPLYELFNNYSSSPNGL